MITVVVFDLGGVLFAEGKAVAIERLYAEVGYDKKIVMGLLTSPESVQLRKGLIADDEFWGWAQKQLPRGYKAHTIKRVWYDGYLIDKDILALIKTLKSGYKVIAFSGNIKSRIEYLEHKYRFREYFVEEVEKWLKEMRATFFPASKAAIRQGIYQDRLNFDVPIFYYRSTDKAILYHGTVIGRFS